jgi:hypothetical protein
MIEDKCVLMSSHDGVHSGLLSASQETLATQLRRIEFPHHQNSVNLGTSAHDMASPSATSPQRRPINVEKLLHDISEELRPSRQPWRFHQTMCDNTATAATLNVAKSYQPRRFRFVIPRHDTSNVNSSNDTHTPIGEGRLVDRQLKRTIFGPPGLVFSRNNKSGRSRSNRGGKKRKQSQFSSGANVDIVSLPSLLGKRRTKKKKATAVDARSASSVEGGKVPNADSESESDSEEDDDELAALLELEDDNDNDDQDTDSQQEQLEEEGPSEIHGATRALLPTLQRLVPWALSRSVERQDETVSADIAISPTATAATTGEVETIITREAASTSKRKGTNTTTSRMKAMNDMDNRAAESSSSRVDTSSTRSRQSSGTSALPSKSKPSSSAKQKRPKPKAAKSISTETSSAMDELARKVNTTVSSAHASVSEWWGIAAGTAANIRNIPQEVDELKAAVDATCTEADMLVASMRAL